MSGNIPYSTLFDCLLDYYHTPSSNTARVLLTHLENERTSNPKRKYPFENALITLLDGLVYHCPTLATHYPKTHSYLKEGRFRAIADFKIKQQTIEKIKNIFSEQKISFILLKGMAVNGNIYSSDNPRPSSDIDILVHSKNRHAAGMLLEQHFEKIIHNKKGFENSYEQTFLYGKNYHTSIDLHFCLAHKSLYTVDENLLWKKAYPHPLYASNKVLCLSNEHFFLHQAIHCTKDMNFISHGVIDVIQMYKAMAIDITKCLQLSTEWNIRPATEILLNTINRCVVVPTFKNQYGFLGKNVFLNWMNNNQFEEKSVKHRAAQLIFLWLLTNSSKQYAAHLSKYIKKRASHD
jgi:predicted nucleotidyltransferase